MCSQIKEQLQFISPPFCKECSKLQAGTGFNIQQNEDCMIAACEKFCDGVPKSFNECLDLPPLCQACSDNYDCHRDKDGEPLFNDGAFFECYIDSEIPF